MGWDDLIDNVEAQPPLTVDNVSMGERAAATSRLLRAMLITKAQRKALAMVALAGRHEGFVLAGDQERVRTWGGQQVRSHAERPVQLQVG
eukprot:1086548-Pyramimonas_sp.AAC.1